MTDAQVTGLWVELWRLLAAAMPAPTNAAQRAYVDAIKTHVPAAMKRWRPAYLRGLQAARDALSDTRWPSPRHRIDDLITQAAESLGDTPPS